MLAAVLLTVGVASAQTSARLFDDSSIQDIYIQVNPKDWQTLRENYLLDTYYPAEFLWNGAAVPRSAIRSRGSGSRSPEKPNLLVAFNRYDPAQRFLGMVSVVLKANNQDASLLREVLAMKLFRAMGIPAPLEAPARLFMNGEYFGAYTLVESMDEAFLSRNFGDASGYLYDWQENRTDGYRFEYLGPDPALYVPTLFDPKTRKSDPDAAGIAAMVRAINQAPDETFVQEVSRYLDLKLFVNYLAVESYLSDYDGFLGRVFGMNNFYFYRFADGGNGVFLPWDKDGACDWAGQLLFEGVEQNVLARRVMQVPELRQMYLAALAKAATLAGGENGWLEQELDRLLGSLRETAANDPHKRCTQSGVMMGCGVAEFEQGVEHVRQFLRLRWQVVLEEATAAGYRPRTDAPRLHEEGVTTASADGGAWVSPGSLASLYGERLRAPAAGAASIMVTFNGARAPVLYTDDNQINVQVPWELTPGRVPVTVFVDGAATNTVWANVAEFAPSIFLIVHAADGQPVTRQRPAARGEDLIVFASGLGPTLGASADWRTVQMPSVSFDNVAGGVESAVMEPSIPGLYLVRLRVPAELTGGSPATLTLKIAGASTTIAVAIEP